MEKKNLFNRELLERPMTAALEVSTELALFGLKVAATAQENSLKVTKSVMDQSAAALDQSRNLTEELIGVNKKYVAEFQKYLLDIWGNAADVVKPLDIKPAAADKKSA